MHVPIQYTSFDFFICYLRIFSLLLFLFFFTSYLRSSLWSIFVSYFLYLINVMSYEHSFMEELDMNGIDGNAGLY